MNLELKIASIATALFEPYADENHEATLTAAEDTMLAALVALRQELDSNWAVLTVSAFLFGAALTAAAV